jgi:hypothetical protein
LSSLRAGTEHGAGRLQKTPVIFGADGLHMDFSLESLDHLLRSKYQNWKIQVKTKK